MITRAQMLQRLAGVATVVCLGSIGDATAKGPSTRNAVVVGIAVGPSQIRTVRCASGDVPVDRVLRLTLPHGMPSLRPGDVVVAEGPLNPCGSVLKVAAFSRESSSAHYPS